MTVVLLQLALDETLLAASAVTAFVGNRIYSGVAPESADLPYLRYGNSSVLARNAFKATRTNHEEVIDIFSGRPDKLEVLEIFAALTEVLHRKPLLLSDGRTVYGNLTLVGTVADPSGGMHGVARLTLRAS